MSASANSIERFYDKPEETGSDASCWAQLRAGDHDALARLYNLFLKPLYNYGIKFCHDGGLVEDAIQELFIEIWNKRGQLSEVRQVKYYLFKSLRRKVVYKLRQTGKVSSLDEPGFKIIVTTRTHFLDEAIDKELRKNVKEIIESLTPKQKEAIFLIYYDGLSYEETASIMGLKVKSVYNLVHLGIQELRKEKATISNLLFFLTL